MKKQITVITLCAVVLALCVPTHAQQAGKIPRIGFLIASSPSAIATRMDAFPAESAHIAWHK